MNENIMNHHHNTPDVAVTDNRGLTVREIQYHRHPGTPDITNERITRHTFTVRGQMHTSADPRLSQAQINNFTYLTTLSAHPLLTSGADNGTVLALKDAAGRPYMEINATGVTRTSGYEDTGSSGRLLMVSEQEDGDIRITERFVYASSTEADQALNLAGTCVSHYDTAGLLQTGSMSLTGAPLSVTRRLLKDADSPDIVADWRGADTSAWNTLLARESEGYTTLTTVDAAGTVLTTTDAQGNRQRVAYDVAGLLKGSWLTLKNGTEQVIVSSLTYSAAGQKLREAHGNGVVTTYAYEPQTQLLRGIKTERPTGHASGAKVLQDLRYEYDPVGNVLKITNDAEETRFWRNQKVVPENTYVYDSMYQLVSATGREMANMAQQGILLPAPLIPLPPDNSDYTRYTRTYTCDTGGNLTRIHHHAPATGNTYTTSITVSDRSNRGVLNTLTANPTEVEALFTAGGHQKILVPGQQLVWTPRGELKQTRPVSRDEQASDSEHYRYDSASQRVSKISMQQTGNSTQIQQMLYLPGLELRTTLSGSTETENLQVITVGQAGRAQVRVLHWKQGKPDAINNNQVRYSYDNLTGSSGLEVDGDGQVISMEEYYPYGGTAILTARSWAEADYKTHRYSGKERDATGLYYYGYRYYQPWAGRWLSADPAGTVDGLNLFCMCRNNPITLRDANGLITQREIDLANKNVLLALRQAETVSAMSQIDDSLSEVIYTEQTTTALPAASYMPGEGQNNNDDEGEEFTHSSLFSHIGYRFALRFLPMRFFRTRLAKYISNQQIRPKIRKGEQYQSTGKLKASEIMTEEAKQIADKFKELAESCKDQIRNGLLHATSEEIDNISFSVNINAHLSKLVGLKPSDPGYVDYAKSIVAQHYYKLVRSGDDTTYGLALVTFDKDKNLTIEGVTVHPYALLRSQQVKTSFDIKGLGTSLSIQSFIRAFKSHPTAKRINTNADNQFSAKIFNRAVSRFR